ncbi:MAG: GNAT family N-acetyltransferase [Rhodobacteraceae bacterium]|nr:GNAT family N-acetyltransferase [Paracoccaceae bacterium]
MMDLQPELQCKAISLRPLMAYDFESLWSAASDPATWAGHPAKDRYKRDVFQKYFTFLLEAGGTLVVIDKMQGKIIGCSRYYFAPVKSAYISIGFTFLSHTYWGGSTNFAVKKLMLDHAFKSTDQVWFHIDPSNRRSQKATAKLGAKHIENDKLDLAGSVAKWMCFRLLKSDWKAFVATRIEP